MNIISICLCTFLDNTDPHIPSFTKLSNSLSRLESIWLWATKLIKLIALACRGELNKFHVMREWLLGNGSRTWSLFKSLSLSFVLFPFIYSSCLVRLCFCFFQGNFNVVLRGIGVKLFTESSNISCLKIRVHFISLCSSLRVPRQDRMRISVLWLTYD